MKKLKQLLFFTICLAFALTGGCQSKKDGKLDTSTTGNSVEGVSDTTQSADGIDETSSEDSSKDKTASKEDQETREILVGAAASLQNAMEELGPLFQSENPNINVTFTFGSSGTLQEQIEQGAPIDVFMSAAIKQMKTLEDEGLILEGTKKELLENKVVLIVPKDSELNITDFKDILKAPIIALGNPESVPVGKYAEEIFTYLNMMEDVKKKASYGKDVTEVLTWVSTGNADAGVVYATDALSSQDVTVVAEAPEGSTSKVLYPVAVVKDSKEAEAAKTFVDFLTSEKAIQIFEKYGFSAVK